MPITTSQSLAHRLVDGLSGPQHEVYDSEAALLLPLQWASDSASPTWPLTRLITWAIEKPRWRLLLRDRSRTGRSEARIAWVQLKQAWCTPFEIFASKNESELAAHPVQWLSDLPQGRRRPLTSSEASVLSGLCA